MLLDAKGTAKVAGFGMAVLSETSTFHSEVVGVVGIQDCFLHPSRLPPTPHGIAMVSHVPPTDPPHDIGIAQKMILEPFTSYHVFLKAIPIDDIGLAATAKKVTGEVVTSLFEPLYRSLGEKLSHGQKSSIISLHVRPSCVFLIGVLLFPVTCAWVQESTRAPVYASRNLVSPTPVVEHLQLHHCTRHSVYF